MRPLSELLTRVGSAGLPVNVTPYSASQPVERLADPRQSRPSPTVEGIVSYRQMIHRLPTVLRGVLTCYFRGMATTTCTSGAGLRRAEFLGETSDVDRVACRTNATACLLNPESDKRGDRLGSVETPTGPPCPFASEEKGHLRIVSPPARSDSLRLDQCVR